MIETATAEALKSKPVWNGKNYRSGFRALLCIKNFKGSAEKHHGQLMRIEADLAKMNDRVTELTQTYSPSGSSEKWAASLKEINATVLSINEVLKSANDKVAKQDKADFSQSWQKLDADLEKLRQSYLEMAQFGLENATETEQTDWQTNIAQFETTILPALVSHVETCKVELQMVEKYTPDQLNQMTQAILAKIPDDFTFEEADKYEQDYLKALADYEQEFSTDKNWWDTFLDILAGGTHQSPEERVMLQSWVEGEKIKV